MNAGISDAKSNWTTRKLVMKAFQKNPAEAFTVVELLIVVAVVAILAAMLLPVIARRNARSSKINCVNNLKQVGLSSRVWAMDNQDKYPMQVSATNGGTMELANTGVVFVNFLVMSNELSTPKILFCPEETDPAKKSATRFDRTSSADAPSQVPFTSDNNVSYFVGVDAQVSRPSMLLYGDGNLAIDGKIVKHGLQRIWTNSAVDWVGPRHGNQGNICFADGSVQQPSSSRLRSVLIETGVATNRLAIP